jgi:hypothetical protein
VTGADRDELQRLQEQYLQASVNDRDRLLPTLIQKLRDAYPRAVEAIETTVRDGSFLLAMFKHSLKSALVRRDLDERRRANTIEDARDFYRAYSEISTASNGLCTRESAVDLATNALFVGLTAGLDPDEIEKLREQFMSERQRQVAEKGVEARRNKEWRKFAKDEALRLHSINPLLTLTDITEKIIKAWEPLKFEKVKQQQLFRYLSRLLDKGELPSSITRRARKT